MTNNNQKIDYLREDEDIPTQRFGCISFIEPRDLKVVTNKEVFLASKFIKAFIEEYEIAKEFASNSNNTITDDIKKKMDLSFENIFDTYKGYRKTHFTKMSEDFDKNHNPKEAITVSGVKVRGSYRTYEEAEAKAQLLRDYEPAVNVFVCAIGKWLPYDPENMEDVDAKFREEQLNDIYGKRQEALELAKKDFDERKKALVEKNKEEQEKKKKLNAEEAMKTMTEDQSHQEKKEQVIKDPPKKKKPVAAKKAGGSRMVKKRQGNRKKKN